MGHAHPGAERDSKGYSAVFSVVDPRSMMRA
jgi:hypothetical protein